MKITRGGDTIGATPDGVLCDPAIMIPASRVTLQMNETDHCPIPSILTRIKF